MRPDVRRIGELLHNDGAGSLGGQPTRCNDSALNPLACWRVYDLSPQRPQQFLFLPTETLGMTKIQR